MAAIAWGFIGIIIGIGVTSQVFPGFQFPCFRFCLSSHSSSKCVIWKVRNYCHSIAEWGWYNVIHTITMIQAIDLGLWQLIASCAHIPQIAQEFFVQNHTRIWHYPCPSTAASIKFCMKHTRTQLVSLALWGEIYEWSQYCFKCHSKLINQNRYNLSIHVLTLQWSAGQLTQAASNAPKALWF